MLILSDRAADEAAERAAIQAEPLLPEPGTAERERMDRRHAEMIGGLLAAYRIRPPHPNAPKDK